MLGEGTADSVKISGLTELFNDTLIPPPLPDLEPRPQGCLSLAPWERGYLPGAFRVHSLAKLRAINNHRLPQVRKWSGKFYICQGKVTEFEKPLAVATMIRNSE